MAQFRDNDQRVILERKLISTTCLILSLTMILSAIFNIALKLELSLILTTIFATFVFASLFYLSKYTRYLNFSKWVVTILSLIFIDLAWYTNNGSAGPTFLLLIVYLAYINFIWNKPLLFYFTAIVAINLIVLFILEYNHPDLISLYPSRKSQIIDLYLGLFISSLIIWFYTISAKNNYLEQYNRAQVSDNLKSLFIRNMSHEIRTPLNSIVGFSELIAEDNLSKEDLKIYSEIIAQNSRSLTGLVNDIIDVSNLESDQLGITYSNFNLASLITRVISDVNSFLKWIKSDVTLSFQSDKFDVMVRSDEGRIEQILRSIIDNAIKFTERGEIKVWLKVDDENAWVYVQDSGIGIKKEHLEIIFNRFTQLEDNVTKLYRGTGIGLFLSRSILHLLHGKIYVDSTLGEGSTFYFSFPKGNTSN